MQARVSKEGNKLSAWRMRILKRLKRARDRSDKGFDKVRSLEHLLNKSPASKSSYRVI